VAAAREASWAKKSLPKDLSVGERLLTIGVLTAAVGIERVGWDEDAEGFERVPGRSGNVQRGEICQFGVADHFVSVTAKFQGQGQAGGIAVKGDFQERSAIAIGAAGTAGVEPGDGTAKTGAFGQTPRRMHPT
jgi:hypothetical protein